MGFIVRKKTRAELLGEIREEKANYDAIKVRLAEARDGAISASVSTAGGSQSYTKADMAALNRQLAVSARRLKALWAKLSGTSAPDKPRRAAVSFSD